MKHDDTCYEDTDDPLGQLLEIMKRLRQPDGCPWDRKQDSLSLAPYLLEEAHEVLEAIEAEDPLWLCEELGDLLLQVVFHAQIHSEHNQFNMQDVIRGISDKLIRRHPHVFGSDNFDTEEELRASWENIKAEEKRQHGTQRKTSALPRHLTALQHAQKASKPVDGLPVPIISPPALMFALEHFEKLDQEQFNTQLPAFLCALAELAESRQVDSEARLRDFLLKRIAST